MGLYPRSAANSVETGGSWDTWRAAPLGTPCATNPWYRLPGNDADRPTITSEKKIPMERTWAEFWTVVVIPEPTPRCSAGRLLIIAARLGAPNDAMDKPMKNR